MRPGGAGSRRAGTFSFLVAWAGSCWSAGFWQGGQALPAGQECLLPWPVRADFQDALAGVPDEAGGYAPEPVTQRIRLGASQAFLVVQAEEPGPGGQVRGDVGREHPAAVDLPCL